MEQENINHKYNTRSKKRQLDTGGNTPTQKNSKAKFHRTISDNEIENENYTKSTFKLDLDKLPKIMIINNSKNDSESDELYMSSENDENYENLRIGEYIEVNLDKKDTTEALLLKLTDKECSIQFENGKKMNVSRDLCSPVVIPEEYDYTEDEEKFLRKKNSQEREEYFFIEEELKNLKSNEIPLRFKILKSGLSDGSIHRIISELDRFSYLENDNENNKLEKWIKTLENFPFGKYVSPKVTLDSPENEIQLYLKNCQRNLDKAVYGHEDAKDQIMQILAKDVVNPNSGGICIGIQGPPGNGKTTLVKEGICNAIDRPFAFIALGGMSDSSFLTGHDYTYEGSKPGRIIEILIETGCCNPVIFFDELDKVSKDFKGNEVTNLLCHLTDSSQNSTFQDKYFSGIDFDLSNAIFIFSYNNEKNINPILLDRMYKIKTQGFSMGSKIKICKNYLLPKIIKNYSFNEGDIKLSHEILTIIITNYTNNEKGVRNLKRCLETIYGKLNLTKLLNNSKEKVSAEKNDKKSINIEIKKKNKKRNRKKNKKIIFKTPFEVNNSNLTYFIKNPHNSALDMMYV